jgi:hypothetical protein
MLLLSHFSCHSYGLLKTPVARSLIRIGVHHTIDRPVQNVWCPATNRSQQNARLSICDCYQLQLLIRDYTCMCSYTDYTYIKINTTFVRNPRAYVVRTATERLLSFAIARVCC